MPRSDCSAEEIPCWKRVKKHWQADQLRAPAAPCMGAATLQQKRVRQQTRQTTKARRIRTPCHFQYIAHWGACGKTRVVPQNRLPEPAPAEFTTFEVLASRRRRSLAQRRTDGGLGAEMGCAPQVSRSK